MTRQKDPNDFKQSFFARVEMSINILKVQINGDLFFDLLAYHDMLPSIYLIYFDIEKSQRYNLVSYRTVCCTRGSESMYFVKRQK